MEDKTKYKVTFDDKDEYTFFAVGEFKFSVGDTINYEVTNAQYKNAKIPKSEYDKKKTFSPANSKDITISKLACLKASAEFHQHHFKDDDIVLQTAQKFFDWYNG